MRLYVSTQRAGKEHGPCAQCGLNILRGQMYVLSKEFNPQTKSAGRQWKRHETCPPLLIESRQYDAAKKGSRRR